jgi:hypothetical protein
MVAATEINSRAGEVVVAAGIVADVVVGALRVAVVVEVVAAGEVAAVATGEAVAAVVTTPRTRIKPWWLTRRPAAGSTPIERGALSAAPATAT